MLSPMLEHGSKIVFFNAVKLVAQSVIGCIPNKSMVRDSEILPMLMRFMTAEAVEALDDRRACAAAEAADGVKPVKLLTESASALGNCMGNSDENKIVLGDMGCVPVLVMLIRPGLGDPGLQRKVVSAQRADPLPRRNGAGGVRVRGGGRGRAAARTWRERYRATTPTI